MGILETVGSIDWEQESYPSYGDFAVLPLFVLFFPAIRFLLDRFVFEVEFAVSVSLVLVCLIMPVVMDSVLCKIC